MERLKRTARNLLRSSQASGNAPQDQNNSTGDAPRRSGIRSIVPGLSRAMRAPASENIGPRASNLLPSLPASSFPPIEPLALPFLEAGSPAQTRVGTLATGEPSSLQAGGDAG
jgi:hypothetical protein